MGRDARAHPRLLQLGLGVLAVAQLIVHAPDILRLLVHQHGGAGIRGRIEPGAALGRVRAVELDVGDQIAAFVGRAGEFEAERLAHGTACTIAGNDPVGRQRVVALRRRDRERDTVRARRHRRDARVPAQVDPVAEGDPVTQRVDEVLLGEALLQVDHRRVLLVRVVRHRELQHLMRTPEAGAADPGETLGERPRGDAERLPDFQAPARDTRGTAAEAHGLARLDHDGADAVAREARRERQPDRSAPDDRHRVAHPRAVELRRPPERIGREAFVDAAPQDHVRAQSQGAISERRHSFCTHAAMRSATSVTSCGCPAR